MINNHIISIIKPNYCFIGAVFLAILFAPTHNTQSAEMAISLNTHEINVNLQFNGANLLVFGALEESGDIIITIRGPNINGKIKKKSNPLGFWVNTESSKFSDIPGYYYWAVSNREAFQKLSEENQNRILLGTLSLITEVQTAPDDEDAPYSHAYNFVRLMAQKGLTNLEPAEVKRLGSHLFRLSVNLPSEAPVGTYLATVYLIKNNRISSAETTPIFIHKSGFSSQMSDMANHFSFFYGFLSIAWAFLFGFLANLVYNPKLIGEYKWQISKFFHGLYALIATRLKTILNKKT